MLWNSRGDELDQHLMDRVELWQHPQLADRMLALRKARQHHWQGPDQVLAAQINRIRCTLSAAAIPDQTWTRFSGTISRRDPELRLPGPDAPAEDIHAWWTSLTRKQQRERISQNWRWLGKIDGVPVVDRHACNVRLLAFERTIRSRERFPNAQQQSVLEGLNQIWAALGIEDDLYLKDLDTDGDGAATMVKNDPDFADRTGILLTGGGAKLELVEQKIKEVKKLEAMIERIDAAHGQQASSSIMFKQYPTGPFVPLEVVRSRQADAVKGKICRFLHGLRVTHHGEPSFATLLTHSYGGMVGARTAEAHGVDVDQAALFGAGATGVDHADAFGLPGKVYTSAIDKDLLAWMGRPRFINNIPPDTPEYGARVYATQEGTSSRFTPGGRTLAAHFEYFESFSLFNLAMMVSGREPVYLEVA